MKLDTEIETMMALNESLAVPISERNNVIRMLTYR